MPSASSRSASWIAWLTHDSPCMPIIPMLSEWFAGIAPMPSRVMAMGIRARSASSRTCPIAPEIRIPWPARMTGRSARLMSSAARCSSDSGGRGSGR